MGKSYMIRKISEMLDSADIVTVESVYRVVVNLTVAHRRHVKSPLKFLLESFEHLFYS